MSDVEMDLGQCVKITLSEDKLCAFLHFTQLSEGMVVTPHRLEILLGERDIVYGIDYMQLSEIAKNPEQFFNEKVTVAHGDAPVTGKDGEIRFLISADKSARKPVELEDGRVDYREILNLSNVQKGQAIAEKIPPGEGTPGKAVTGEPISAKPGKEARFKLGKNVVVNPEDTTMYAAIDGLVSRTDRDKINVFPVYEVNGDVDFEIGNIDFVGTVVIRGNVLTGFKVKAAGDIRVIGGVDGAELFAGGSIEVTEGILGHNKGFVKAEVNVKSAFITDANVEAGEEVIVSQSIMHSKVRAGKNIICKGSKGLVVGGVLQAGESLTARTVGNTMSTQTTIEVGVSPEVRNELIERRKALQELDENLDKTNKALHLLDQLASTGQLNSEKMAMRIKLNTTKKHAEKLSEEHKERILEIEKMLSEGDKAQVDIISVIYPGTKIVLGRYTKFIQDPVKNVRFVIKDGEIVLRSNN